MRRVRVDAVRHGPGDADFRTAAIDPQVTVSVLYSGR
jgi:hypothetical protein